MHEVGGTISVSLLKCSFKELFLNVISASGDRYIVTEILAAIPSDISPNIPPRLSSWIY